MLSPVLKYYQYLSRTHQCKETLKNATKFSNSPFADIFDHLQRQHHFEYLLSLSQTKTNRARWSLVTSTRRHRIRWSPTFSTPSTTPLWCIFTKSLAKWLAVSPMDSCHGNLSPTNPMEAFCQHFPPQPQKLWCIIISLLRTDFRWVWLMAFIDQTQFGCIGQRSYHQQQRVDGVGCQLLALLL